MLRTNSSNDEEEEEKLMFVFFGSYQRFMTDGCKMHSVSMSPKLIRLILVIVRIFTFSDWFSMTVILISA